MINLLYIVGVWGNGAPWRLFRIDQLAVKYWQTYVIFICTILVMDLVVYVWRGVKDDVL